MERRGRTLAICRRRDDRTVARFRRANTASARGITSILTLAKSEPGIAILPAVLDTHPWLLNCQNGTLDLRTGKLREHRHDDYLTKICPVAYDAAATCPVFEKTLSTSMGNNAGLIEFIQRAFGYSLTGSVEEQVLVLLWGTGANGKSTLVNAFLATLGPDYAMQAPDRLLMVKHGESHPTERGTCTASGSFPASRSRTANG